MYDSKLHDSKECILAYNCLEFDLAAWMTPKQKLMRAYPWDNIYNIIDHIILNQYKIICLQNITRKSEHFIHPGEEMQEKLLHPLVESVRTVERRNTPLPR